MQFSCVTHLMRSKDTRFQPKSLLLLQPSVQTVLPRLENHLAQGIAMDSAHQVPSLQFQKNSVRGAGRWKGSCLSHTHKHWNSFHTLLPPTPYWVSYQLSLLDFSEFYKELLGELLETECKALVKLGTIHRVSSCLSMFYSHTLSHNKMC